MYEWSSDKPVPADQLQLLFRQTTWARDRSIDDIARAVGGSWACLGVWDGDRLVGFGRIVSDGVYRALLDDIVVDEGLRGKGLGHRIVTRLLEIAKNIEETSLSTGHGLAKFYAAHGFEVYGGCHMKLHC